MTTDRATAPPRTYQVRTLRLPDERARLRADRRSAGAGRLRARSRGRRRPGRRGLQHLRGPGERRQPALRQPRPAAAGQGGRTRACRSRSAAAWRRRTAARSSQRRPGSTWSSARTTSVRCRCCWSGPGTTQAAAGGDPRVAGGLPVHAAHAPRVDVLRLGVDLGGLQQHLHVLHRAGLRGKEQDRRPGDVLAEVRGAGRRGRAGGDPARPERQLLRRGVRRPVRVRQAAARLRGDRGPGAGPLHQPAPEGLHRRRDRGDGGDAERLPPAAHAAAVRLRRGAQADAPLLPVRALPRHHREGPRGDAGRRDHHRHHRRLPGRDRGGLPSTPWTWSAQARFAGAFTFQYSMRPGTPGRRRCPTRCPSRWCRSGTSGWSRCVEEISWRRTSAWSAATGRGAGRGRRGPQGRATGRLSGRARDGRLVHFARPTARAGPARRRRARRRSPTRRRTT